jgi:hypothetical protein
VYTRVGIFSMESTMCNSPLDPSTVIKSGRTKSNAERDRVRLTESLPAQYRSVCGWIRLEFSGTVVLMA